MEGGTELEPLGLAPYQFEPTDRGSETSTDDDSDNGEERPTGSAARLGNTSWCVCGKCSALPTEPECICCKEIPHIRHLLGDEHHSCITDNPEFPVICLQPLVLRVALVGMMRIRGDTIDFPVQNRSYRHAAYRQYIWWSYNICLGRRIRRVILSCVVTAIRKEFPEPDNNYVGYKEYTGV